MEIIFFVPIGLILLFILIIAGGFVSLAENLIKIIYDCSAFILFILGIVVIINGILKAKKENNFLYGLTQTIKGIYLSVLILLIKYFLYIGKGQAIFQNAKYTLLGTFEGLDIYIVSLLISILLLLIINIPSLIFKKKQSKTVYSILTILLILLPTMSIYKMSLNDSFYNNNKFVIWDSHEYEVINTTSIKQKEFIDLISPITGNFKHGTKLYTTEQTYKINNSEHVLVTDGEKMGYVLAEDLKSLVTYTYITNTESELYEIGKRNATMYINGQHKIITISAPSSNIITTIEKGTSVIKIDTYAEDLKVTKMLVELSDGTQGYINIENITEIRK